MAVARGSLGVFRARPFPAIASFLLTGAALANALDALTTAIGLGEGFREVSPAAIAVMQGYGLAGFEAEKLLIVSGLLAVYLYQRHRWERSNETRCLVILALAAVAFTVSTLPVLNNVGLLVGGHGM